jgi:class 3 adenylate cyclase
MSQVIEKSPLQAGREAFDRHAWHEAFELLTEADASEKLEADDLDKLAQAAWWSGRLEECISARERAYGLFLDAGKPHRAALTALMLASDYFDKLAHSIGAGWFGRAERLLESEPESAEHGYLAMMHSVSALRVADFDSALASAEKTLDIGTRFGDRDLQAYGLLLKGKVLVSRGDVDEGLPLLDEATVAAVGGEIGPLASGIIYCMAISTSASLADYERAGQWTEASMRWCERQAISGFPGVCRVHRAEIMRLRGSWTEAEQEARRALTELKNFNLEIAAHGFYELGEVRFRMGDLEAAADAFRQAHELGRDPQPGLALLRLQEGKKEAALSSIKRALRNESDRLERARQLPGLVEIAVAAGELEEARPAVQELEEIAETYGSRVLQASALCARGALEIAEGRAADAVDTLHESWRLWKEADLPYEAAKARLMYGTALRADGDEDAARLEIEAARAAFQELGAAIDLKRTFELLGEEHAPPTKAAGERLCKTFMFTDIVGSTNLADAMGDQTWETTLAWHDSALRQLFDAYGGEEVKQIGDGFFVAFDRPSSAVECAVAVQRRLAAQRKEHGFAPPVRIGLHVAEATRTGRDYAGMGVNEAARIGALAEGGEILASKDFFAEAGSIRFPVSPSREVTLRGVSRPVEVASIDPS